MPVKEKAFLPALVTGRCPKCRIGNIFVQKSVFPLKYMLRMQEYCPACRHKLQLEHNFGQGMNFVFIISIFVLTLCWYWPLMGLSLYDDSIFYYLGISVFFCLVLQPWLMRFSRILFMYLVMPYDATAAATANKAEKVKN